MSAFFFGMTPPSNANFTLLSHWKEVASSGLPILVFKAPSVKVRGGDFDYLKYILGRADRKSRVTVEVIEGAGHTFSNRIGRDAVRQSTENWLSSNFPLLGQSAALVNLPQREEAALNSLEVESGKA